MRSSLSGRATRTTRSSRERTIHFDDREVVREELALQMLTLPLDTLVEVVAGEIIGSPEDVVVNGLAVDSRDVEPGNCVRCLLRREDRRASSTSATLSMPVLGHCWSRPTRGIYRDADRSGERSGCGGREGRGRARGRTGSRLLPPRAHLLPGDRRDRLDRARPRPRTS